MLSFKRYLALSFMFVGFLFLSSIIFAVTFGYDIDAECKRNCSSGTCLLNASSGKYICRLSVDVEPIGDCKSGQTQNKYTASGCSYTTQTRTCCSDGTWSDWDGECGASSSCGLNECWNGLKCEAKGTVSKTCSGNIANAKSGTLTRTATCGSSGWSYGSWTGTCICNTGYTWNNSSKTCGAKTCSGGDFYNANSDKCCSVGSYMVSPGTNGNYMFVSCTSNELDVTGECCTMSNKAEFQLPSSAGSCSEFASKAGLSMGYVNRHACSKLL